MAYTIPTGYKYWDESALKYYTAGQTFNGTPGENDSLTPTTSGANVTYYYNKSHTLSAVVAFSSDPDNLKKITISAGWQAQCYSIKSKTSVSFLNSIAGKNVVEVNLAQSNPSITTVSNVPNKVEYMDIVGGSSSKIQTINGTMPSTLKYFSAYQCSTLRSVPNFNNCTNWKYGYSCFEETHLITAPTLPSSLQIIDEMFRGCTYLTTGAAIPASATRAERVYYNCTSLTAAPANNSTIVTNLSSCFRGCTAMTSAANFNIRGNSVDANCIFKDCTTLVTGPTITSVQNLSYGFHNCRNLRNWTTQQTTSITLPSTITNLNNTFGNCSSLTETPNLYNATNISSLESTFLNCSSLTTINPFPQQVATSLDCLNTFKGCTSLTTIPLLPNYIGSMKGMFAECTNLQPQNIYIPQLVSSLESCFSGVQNLSGIVTLNRNISAISNAFNGVNGPIIITGSNELNSTELLMMGSNVYKELEITPDTVTSVRCRDTSGTLDDNGNYVKLTVHFTSIVLPSSLTTALYVPKVYIKTDQQEPVIDWKLTNVNTGITTTISNSTSIQADRITAGDLISEGIFETYFEIGENEVLSYKIYIPTSANNVYDWDTQQSEVVTITKYWNGIAGSSIFTSSTYIFDATPDGLNFKIGGPIDETTEHGFIVGNSGIVNTADQYPSTFNGPATFNSQVFITYFAGMIQMFAGLTAPAGWLFCDGSVLSRTTYPELFDVIGYTYGGSNDAFYLPDFRDRMPVGAGNLYTCNSSGGNKDAIIPYHRHSVDAVSISSSGGHTHTISAKYTSERLASGTARTQYYASGENTSTGMATIASNTGTHTHSVPSHNTNYAGSSGNTTDANMPPYRGINFIICTGKTF